jgi:hypothetical protein
MELTGCKKCANKKSAQNKKLTLTDFIEQSKKVHSDFYDYSYSILGKNNKEKIKILCPSHGIFLQSPNHHLRGVGCNLCGISRASQKNKLTLSEFLSRAYKIHGNLYSYSNLMWDDRKEDKIRITCRDHGDFWQKPLIHVTGSGCQKCGRKIVIDSVKMNVEEFISKAEFVHNDFYVYDRSTFKSVTEKTRIICPIHGEFYQQVSVHLNGSKCKKCRNKWVKQDLWLDSLNIPRCAQNRQVKLIAGSSTYVVDGYNPSTNTAYEFWGDFWHGNPVKYNLDDIHPICAVPYGKLLENTKLKVSNLKKSGFNVIEMWESDWME